MRIGLFREAGSVDELVAATKEAHAAGFGSMWAPQIFSIDAITALTVAACEVPDIRLGSAVIPTYPRHPSALAAQARTLQQVSGGRFTLGIGLSHQIVIESMFGMTWGEVRHLREYLSILMPLVRGEGVSFEGETLTGNVALAIEADPVPVLVAALGPKMLKLAGSMTEGTVTWMTGPETIRSHVSPSIRAAADEAGRPEPQCVMALPTCVTDDVAGAKERAARTFAVYGQLPSYRAMLDREGAEGPADVAIIGTADEVKERIAATFEAGATEFVAVPFHQHDATLEAVAELL
jgi:F420-dependent oxidoreductase-like protein